MSLYYFDNKQHKQPRIHAKYSDSESMFSIVSGEMIEGNLPNKKAKLIEAWIEIHRDNQIADWELAINWNDLPQRLQRLCIDKVLV